MECYREEEIRLPNPLFTQIPLTVVLTMEGSPRRESYMRQLLEYRPTARVVIQHNRGWRDCSKPGWVTNTALDLWHANHVAMRHGGPMLILEDDVRFLPALRELAPEIERFVLSEKVDAYSLGSTAGIGIPVSTKHIRMWKGGATQAVIYTLRGTRRGLTIVPKPKEMFHDNVFIRELQSYTPVRVCAIQSHPETENSRLWAWPGNIDLKLAYAAGDYWYPIHHVMAFVGGRDVVSALLALAVVICLLRFVRIPRRH